MIIIAGVMTLDPAKADDFMAVAVKMMRETHKEEGNLAYVFSRSPLDDGTIHLFEKWETEEALAAHMASDHMAEFQAGLGDVGLTGADVKKYTECVEGELF